MPSARAGLYTFWEPGLVVGAVEMMDDKGTLRALPLSQSLAVNSLIHLRKLWGLSRGIWRVCPLTLFFLDSSA